MLVEVEGGAEGLGLGAFGPPDGGGAGASRHPQWHPHSPHANFPFVHSSTDDATIQMELRRSDERHGRAWRVACSFIGSFI